MWHLLKAGVARSIDSVDVDDRLQRNNALDVLLIYSLSWNVTKIWSSCLSIDRYFHVALPTSFVCDDSSLNEAVWYEVWLSAALYRCTEPMPKASAGFWLGVSMPPCRLRWRKFWNFFYEVVHSEVYLTKYVVSIAPFSTSACPDCSQNCSFWMFSFFFNFSSSFQGVSWPHLPLCADSLDLCMACTGV